jgi:cytochrome c-type biogenesis protein CcmH
VTRLAPEGALLAHPERRDAAPPGTRAIRLALILFLGFAPTALAVQPDERLADPVLEERAREISAGLRCLVCQNQSIDDSDAPLARDLRLLVRDRLKAGDSDGEVRDYLVARYGEFILLRPPFSSSTLLLWLTPVLVLAVGAAAALLMRRRPAGVSDRLTREEEERLARIVEAEK